MPRPDRERGLLPSVLDRLVDPSSSGAGPLLGYDLTRMVEAVRRDLEELLNTRQSHQGMGDEFAELKTSILTYGIPDFTSIDASKSGQRQTMGRIIESIIARFEPRLREVRAVPIDRAEDEEIIRQVRFQIQARLRLEPNPEVGFETVVELLSGHTSVRPKEG